MPPSGRSRGRGMRPQLPSGRGNDARAPPPSTAAAPVISSVPPPAGVWSQGPPPVGRGLQPAGAWGRGAPPGLRPAGQPARVATPKPIEPQQPRQQEAAPTDPNYDQQRVLRNGSPDTGSPNSSNGNLVPTAATPGGDSRARDFAMDDLREAFNEIFKGHPPTLRERQKPGSEGRPIDLCLNMFNVKLPSGYVYHYDVEIYSVRSYTANDSGEVIEKRSRCAAMRINREVIDAFSRQYRVELKNAMLAFDGNKNLYTRKKLDISDHPAGHSFNNIDVRIDGEIRVFVVHLRLVAVISFDHLNAVYDQNQIGFENFQDAVQAADVVLRTAPALNFNPVGRSFFSPPKPDTDGDCALGGFRETWFGFYTSIRLGRWKPVVNIDMSATAFYTAGPLLDLVADLLRRSSKDELARSELSDRDRVTVAREIKMLKVTATHLKSERQQRIEGLSRRSANQESFEWNGRKVTVSQYFIQKYNIHLRFPLLPCVLVGKKNSMLPMEFCNIVRGQHCKKKLNETQTAKMIRKTALSPRDRFARIKKSVDELEKTSRHYLDEFDMKIGTTPLEVRGRVLPAPGIKYGAGKTQHVRDGVWNTDVFLRAAQMKEWAIVNLGRETKQELRAMVRFFQDEGHKLGMRIEEPRFVNQCGNRANVRRVLEDVKNRIPNVEMTVVVLDKSSPYGTIKAEAETSDLCMRTQCVKHRNVETKMNPMFASNLLQKINTKLGGQNNGVAQVMLETFREPFMVVGMDVNHPAPNDRETPSVAAMVASIDSVPSQYHSCTSVQINRRGRNQEYIVATETMFLECLSVFKNRTNVLPKSVYIFRDGISEGQFSAVRMYELGAIRKACLTIDPNFTPYVTFIVVQKRHHVRMKPKFDRDGVGRSGNVPPGTVIDSEIVHPEIFDFYLCSQQGLQGTSRPAHYHVVHDDRGHRPDEIYRLCYHLCHVYARCARTVSIPAPAYYAHLAAFRAKEHLKRIQHEDSETSHSDSGKSNISPEVLRRFQEAQRVNSQMRSTMYFV